MNNKKLQRLIEIALFAALALVLQLFFPKITPTLKITIKMLPIVIVALRWGTGAGLTSGLLWGVLQILVGKAEIVSLPQAIIEYLLAFAAIGMAGLFARPLQTELSKEKPNKAKLGLWAGLATIVGSICRYFLHFIAGIVFWGQYAPAGQSPALYSFLLNGKGFLSETLTCIIVMLILIPSYKAILRNRAMVQSRA